MQIAINNLNEKFEASQLTNQATGFFCPHCKESVLFKRGKIRVWHFAHIGNSNCPLAKETPEHQIGKILIKQLLKKCDWNQAEMEKSFLQIDRRADVYAESKSNLPVVFEIQNSQMNIGEVIQRTKDYNSIGIAVVWVPIIKAIDTRNSDCLFLINGKTNLCWTKEFRLQDWQVMMNDYHANKILACVLKGPSELDLAWMRLFRCKRRGSEWYGQGGEVMTSKPHTMSNTYESYIFDAMDFNEITISKQQRPEWNRNDHKKGWNIRQIFGQELISVTLNIKGKSRELPIHRPN